MSLKGTVWAPIGPSPIDEGGTGDNGLVTCIAPHPTNPNILYIGTAGGGVWKSVDQGANWTPLFDRQMSLAIGENGALAIDPNNPDTIYAGTSGRLIFRTFSSDTGTFTPVQVGIYKSTDGGASWILLGSGFPAGNNGNASQFVGLECNVLIVDPDPTQSDFVYVATNTGLFFSHDGGQNWTPGTGVAGDARTLQLDATSPPGARILYAGVTGQGVFRSTNGGQTWNVILSGTTPVLANALCPSPPCTPPRFFGMFVVALAPPASPPNPAGIQVIYAAMEGNPISAGAPNPVGIFVSTDQGASWTQQGGSGIATTTYNGYCLVMAVDPQSPGDGVSDIIYFGDIFQSVSTNAGNSFSGVSGTHADTHAFGFIPQPGPSSIALIGCDGGLFISFDTGSTWASRNSGGLQTSLFYNIDVRPDATASVTVGALQDNSLETTAGASGLGWNAGGNDGFAIKYDSGVASQVYGCENSGTNATSILLSTDDGQSYSSITPWSGASDTGAYIAPIGTDPNTGGVVYALGSQNLWQSQNGGGSWTNIFPNIGPGGNDVNIATTNGNNVVIAVGGSVYVSTNALGAAPSFTNITRNLPGRNVARVAFDPSDPSTIYAVLGGLGPPGGNVYRTTITATSWIDVSPPLAIPFSALALDGSDTPTTVYAGTEFGVLRSVDLGSTWYVLDDIHLPHVPVMSLALHDGFLRAGTYGRGVFKFALPTGPAIAVNLQHGLNFETICTGPKYLTLTVYDVGATDLTINFVQLLMGSTSFSVLSTPATPVIVAAGDSIEFTIEYDPTVPAGPETSIIRISSNDPTAPFVDIPVTGTLGTPSLAYAIANSGNFGDVCVGHLRDEELTINNNGLCPLSIFSITATGEFVAPALPITPLVISAGSSLMLPVRFQPTIFGSQAGILTIFSSDPTSPHVIGLSGTAPAPRLALMMADSGNFGRTCVGCFTDKFLTLINCGPCTLTVSSITPSSTDFLVPEVVSYPLTIAAGVSLQVPIRFEPTSFGPESATITVVSDDPASPATINVSGDAPSGTLAVSGSTAFGGVNACCCADRTISICNVGDCSLNVTSVAFKRKSHHWKLLHNPFPAKLHPGSCLPVIIQYRATEKCARCCELVIESDDPMTPVKILDVMAYTIWGDCCKEHCQDCGKGCCQQQHKECHCQQGYECCCDDDEDDGDE